MASGVKKITERVQEAWINPELDRVKAEVRAALAELKDKPDKSDLVTGIIERGKRGLRRDLGELKVPEDEWSAMETAFERRFKVATASLEKDAILKSLEAKMLDAFVNDYSKHTQLEAVIDECRKKESKDPLKRFVRTIQKATPLFAGLSAGFMSWLNEGKKAEGATQPVQGLETSAVRADEVITSGAKPKPETPTATPPVSGRAPSSGGAPASGSGSAVESAGGVKYEVNPDNSKKLSPEEFRKRYESIKDRHARYMFVLQQIAAGNATNAFEKLRITGGEGSVVEVDVEKRGLEVAGMPVQLDGPAAMAAAQLTDCDLPDPWLAEKTYEQAKKTGGVIEFIDYDRIAKALNIPEEKAYTYTRDPVTGETKKHPNGKLMMSAQFAVKRDEMLKAWRKDHQVSENQLVDGYFKYIVRPGTNRPADKLSIYGGKDANGNTIQKDAGPHEITYSDYSHQVRRIRRKVKVTRNNKTIEIDASEFFSNPAYAKEFGFEVARAGQAYPYPPTLQRLVENLKPGEKPSVAPVAVASAPSKRTDKPTT